MVNRLKQYLLIGIVLATFYFLLSHHIIFTSVKEFAVLKKQELTLKETFYSLNNKSIMDILRNDRLMDAGIEDVLLEWGMVSEEQLDSLLRKINSERKE
ncbi:MAG: hypothetical protein PVJ84_00715 [Desulfobacteraceae bacterium]|jgi:hypothetical protein